MSTPFSASTARKLAVKMRPDLIIERQHYLGQLCWILKDPIGSRYFRLQDEEYFLLQQFDGNHSLEEIKQAFQKQYPPQKISFDELQHLLGQFHQSGLILASAPHQGDELLKRNKKRKRKERTQKFTNILAVKFKGFDPDALLTFLTPFVKWCFYPLTLTAGLLLCLTAATLILVQFDTFYSQLPEFYTFFSPVNIVCLGFVLAVTKVLHEFGHGLTAKHFGGECHEMGIMFLVLTPCLYVNVSDSWLLPNKWHRIAIAAAGICIELVLAALCTLIWRFSEPGLLHYLALNVMFISSVSTIVFNINPLLRYDGYYMLSDYLEIPNLRQKASKILTQKCSQWFLGMEQPDDPFLPKKNQVWFALYSVAAFCYRWVLMASILFFIYTLFKQYELRIVGQAVAAMSLFSLFVMPIIKVIKFFWIPGRIYRVKAFRFYTSLALLAGLVLFILLCPLPYTVVAPAIIELRSQAAQQVFVPENRAGSVNSAPGAGRGSRLREIHVKPGQSIKAGDVLAVLQNPILERELIQAESRCKELSQELQTIETMRNYQSEAALRIGQLKESLAVAQELWQNKKRDAESLILRAPISGTVFSPPWKPHQSLPEEQLPQWSGSPLDEKNLFATLESGTEICSIGDPKLLEAVLIIDQSRMPFLKLDQNIELKLHEYPDRTYLGKIAEMEQQSVSSLAPQLSTRAGGEVPTSSQPDGSELPNRASYRVRMLLDNESDLSIRIGMTGLGKVHVENQTLGFRLWRLVNETFNFRL